MQSDGETRAGPGMHTPGTKKHMLLRKQQNENDNHMISDQKPISYSTKGTSKCNPMKKHVVARVYIHQVHNNIDILGKKIQKNENADPHDFGSKKPFSLD